VVTATAKAQQQQQQQQRAVEAAELPAGHTAFALSARDRCDLPESSAKPAHTRKKGSSSMSVPPRAADYNINHYQHYQPQVCWLVATTTAQMTSLECTRFC
jgi:hypothetical protein